MMRRHNHNFCVVCTEQWIRAIYKRSKIADGFWPEFQLPQPPILWDKDVPITFKARVIRDQDIKTVWRTKRLEHIRWRRRQASENYRDFTVALRANRLAGQTIPTAWAVECILEDRSDRIRTPSIRSRSRQRQRWYIITM